MTSRRLVVIEAPRKAVALQETLLQIGLEARVQATRGHLLESPMRASDPLGIDRGFREFTRLPINPEVIERLRAEAREADEVFVATDADREGEVIAWDVVTLIQDIHPHCMRVRLRGMDPDSVRQAFDTMVPVDRRDAIPGRARAVVDRMIGLAFSGREVKVGRVSTAMLGLVAKTQPSVRRLTLSAPAKDGGRPYTATCDLGGALDEETAASLTRLRLPPLDLESSGSAPKTLGHTGDILVRASDYLDIAPHEAMDSMQKMYEVGKLSYPRSSSKAMSPSACVKFAAIMKKNGYTMVDGEYVKKTEDDVHDAPHPIGPVDVSSDPARLGHHEGVRSVIARDLVRAGLPRTEQRPAMRRLEDFLGQQGYKKDVVAKVVGLDWRREVGPRYPGEVNWPKSGIETRRADTVLLEKTCEVGLGRPSTWAAHVKKFMSRGLVDEDLSLTARGRHWLENSPAALLDPRIAVAIENACDRCPSNFLDDPQREPWELLSEAIVQSLPASLRAPLLELVAHEDPRPRYDPAADFTRRELSNAQPEVDPQLSNRIDEAMNRRLSLELEMD